MGASGFTFVLGRRTKPCITMKRSHERHSEPFFLLVFFIFPPPASDVFVVFFPFAKCKCVFSSLGLLRGQETAKRANLFSRWKSCIGTRRKGESGSPLVCINRIYGNTAADPIADGFTPRSGLDGERMGQNAELQNEGRVEKIWSQIKTSIMLPLTGVFKVCPSNQHHDITHNKVRGFD